MQCLPSHDALALMVETSYACEFDKAGRKALPFDNGKRNCCSSHTILLLGLTEASSLRKANDEVLTVRLVVKCTVSASHFSSTVFVQYILLV